MRVLYRSRILVAGVMVPAVVGSLGLTAVVPASAVDPSPVVSYIDDAVSGTRVLSVAAPDGGGPQVLMPSDKLALTYDVSADGNTLLVGLATGAAYPHRQDRSYGLVLLQRTPSGTTSTLLSTTWDVDAQLSADGRTAWWVSGGAVYKHTPAGTVRVSASLFAPGPGERLSGFAASADGTRGAAVYVVGGGYPPGQQMRVFAAGFSAGRKGPYLESVTTGRRPAGQPVWVDAASVLYRTSDTAIALSSNEIGRLAAGGSGDLAPCYECGDVYDVVRRGGQWWVWRDWLGPTEYAAVPTFGDLRDATWTPRSNGATTFRYRPSTATPPSFVRPSARAVPVPHLFIPAAGTTTGRRLPYAAYADYTMALPGQTLAKNGSWTARGTLEWSTDLRRWTSLGATSWAHPVPWPRSTSKGNAYTPVLTRNTWFRWRTTGDDVLAPSAYVRALALVAPVVKVAVARVSGLRRVSGTATRAGGVAVLQRLAGGRTTMLATARISARGAFTFAARPLARGAYRVVTRADAGWASGVKGLRI